MNLPVQDVLHINQELMPPLYTSISELADVPDISVKICMVRLESRYVPPSFWQYDRL
jgi:hypothetical protein